MWCDWDKIRIDDVISFSIIEPFCALCIAIDNPTIGAGTSVALLCTEYSPPSTDMYLTALNASHCLASCIVSHRISIIYCASQSNRGNLALAQTSQTNHRETLVSWSSCLRGLASQWGMDLEGSGILDGSAVPDLGIISIGPIDSRQTDGLSVNCFWTDWTINGLSGVFSAASFSSLCVSLSISLSVSVSPSHHRRFCPRLLGFQCFRPRLPNAGAPQSQTSDKVFP